MAKITVFVVNTDGTLGPRLVEDTLESYQALVGGYIEIALRSQDLILVCNEEGMIRNLPLNPFTLDGQPLYGDVFFVGRDDSNEQSGFKSLSNRRVNEILAFFE